MVVAAATRSCVWGKHGERPSEDRAVRSRCGRHAASATWRERTAEDVERGGTQGASAARGGHPQGGIRVGERGGEEGGEPWAGGTSGRVVDRRQGVDSEAWRPLGWSRAAGRWWKPPPSGADAGRGMVVGQGGEVMAAASAARRTS